MNLRPFGPEPNALPNCATPRHGANKGTRTLDLRFTKPLLYQLSYIGASATSIIANISFFVQPFFEKRQRFLSCHNISAISIARRASAPPEFSATKPARSRMSRRYRRSFSRKNAAIASASGGQPGMHCKKPPAQRPIPREPDRPRYPCPMAIFSRSPPRPPSSSSLKSA